MCINQFTIIATMADPRSYSYLGPQVLQGQNRDGGEKRQQDLPSGEGETLAGRRLASFGDRAVREQAPSNVLDQGKDREKTKSFDELLGRRLTKQQLDIAPSDPATSHDLKHVNFAAIEVNQDLLYRPRTKENQFYYDQLMHLVQKHLGDANIETTRDALDEILAVLKDENMIDTARKQAIDSFLGGSAHALTEDEFGQMTVLAGCLTDYNAAREDAANKIGNQEDAAAEGLGQDIAIDLDDEEDNQEQVGGNVDEVQSEIAADQSNDDVSENDLRLSVEDITVSWLQRTLSARLEGTPKSSIERLTVIIVKLLCDRKKPASLEKDLKQAVSEYAAQQIPDNIGDSPIDAGADELVPFILKNANILHYGMRLSTAKPEDKDRIRQEMTQSGQSALVEGAVVDMFRRIEELDQMDRTQRGKISYRDLKQLELEVLRFQQGSRLMSNKKCTLPRGSTRENKPGYEEVCVPANKQDSLPTTRLVKIRSLPDWAQSAFPSSVTELNRIQSVLYQAAFTTPQNLLVCAPTGAGKTNIAMLTMLQLIGEMRAESGKLALNKFKIVYIAPMKALVTEVAGNFRRRLESYGITVNELTGDSHLSRQQIERSQVIVTTPEKWDIITRKSGERNAFVEQVKLLIIDEVHLLHDMRGPVLEAIIARTMRQIEETQELVRIVGLSATLPNYKDVAALLRVEPSGLHYFDARYRPVPLEQIYIGISERKALKKLMLQNEICFEKVCERAEAGHQVLVFVHSRKETARTAKQIRDLAVQQQKQQLFCAPMSESQRILLDMVLEQKLVVSKDLCDLLVYGIGIHHAGLSKSDRSLVEDLFAAGHLTVLISTATLAWGVNLPAHTVIIKGTQIYSPEQGKWVDLSPQDILQMMGRAGRPQYDVQGEGIIITNHADLQYYLSLNNMQLPIESQLMHQLADQLNAEIVLGTVTNLREAISWLQYTYLYIRMRRNPTLYGVEQDEDDRTLVRMRLNLVHSAALKLVKAGMVRYDRKSGTLAATAIGKVASHYYVKAESMQVYLKELKPTMGTIDVLRVFALSKEFENLIIRENEKPELQKFIDRVPIPVKGGLEETATKVNILLQAYIARFRLEGFDLNSDMVYVTQSASRIMRALFEIAIKKQWASLAECLLNVSKMVERRQWYCSTPLRQYATLLESSGNPTDFKIAKDLTEIARKIERKDQFRWQDLADFSAEQLGELVKQPKMGKMIHGYLQMFPRLAISAYVQPITRKLIQVELEISPHDKFSKWDRVINGSIESFWLLVSDADNELLLHSEHFSLHEYQAKNGSIKQLQFLVPLTDPLPPVYFVKLISDRWLQCEHTVPISFKNLVLPDKFTAPLELDEEAYVEVRSLNFPEAEKLYERDAMSEFPAIVASMFKQIYRSGEDVFVALPPDCIEQRTIAELALFREFKREDFQKGVYVAAKFETCAALHSEWQQRLGEGGDLFGLEISLISNELGLNHSEKTKILNADIIIVTAAKWELLTRDASFLDLVSVYIFDQLHMMQGMRQTAGASVVGAAYEVLITRIKLQQVELRSKSQKAPRIVAMTAPLAPAKDICNWLGISVDHCFNYAPAVRANCPSQGLLQMSLQVVDTNSRKARLTQMTKPTYAQIRAKLQEDDQAQAIVITADVPDCEMLVHDLLNMALNDENDKLLRAGDQAELEGLISGVKDPNLKQSMEIGAVWITKAMEQADRPVAMDLFSSGRVKLLVATYDQVWSLRGVTADLVVLHDPLRFDSGSQRHVNLPLATILQAQSLAVSKDTAQMTIMCHGAQKEELLKTIAEPLPMESSLPTNLHEHVNALIAGGQVASIQDVVDWITCSYLYRRIGRNPNFYEVAGKGEDALNEYLSELVEDTVTELAEHHCIELSEDMDVRPLLLGKIAAQYNLRHGTAELFAQKLVQPKARKALGMRQILEVLCSTVECNHLLESASFDAATLRLLALNLPFDVNSDADYQDPATVAFVLLQCHFGRKAIPFGMRPALRALLMQALQLTQAMVNLLGRLDDEVGSLKPCLLCLELSQMLVQAQWTWQSPLLQLPQLTREHLDQLQSAQVEDIADFMNMEDEKREKLVPLPPAQMEALAAICNRYPSVELETRERHRAALGEEVRMRVELRRDLDEGEFGSREEFLEELKTFDTPVDAKRFPLEKDEQWWLLVTVQDAETLGHVMFVDRVLLKTQPNKAIDVNFTLSQDKAAKWAKNGRLNLKLYAVCDAYLGIDLEKEVQLTVEGV